MGTPPRRGHRAPSGPGGCLSGRGAEPPAPPEEAQQSLQRWPGIRDPRKSRRGSWVSPAQSCPGASQSTGCCCQRQALSPEQLDRGRGAEPLLRQRGQSQGHAGVPTGRPAAAQHGTRMSLMRKPKVSKPTSNRWPLRPSPATSSPSHSHAAPSLPLLRPSTLGPPDASLPLTAPHWPLSQPAGCTIEMYLEFTCVSLSSPPASWSRLHDVSWIKTASSLSFPSLLSLSIFSRGRDTTGRWAHTAWGRWRLPASATPKPLTSLCLWYE